MGWDGTPAGLSTTASQCVGEEQARAVERRRRVGAAPGLLQVHGDLVAAVQDAPGDLAALAVEEDPAPLEDPAGLAAGDAAPGRDEAVEPLAVVGGAGGEGEALHACSPDTQASADGQPAQPAPRGALQAAGLAAVFAEPLSEKEPALITFFTGEPQASCRRSGGADIRWRVSKRPHFGQSYS